MVEFVFYIINSFVFILLRRRRRHRRYCCHRCCCRRRHRCGCRCHQRCRRHRRRHHHHHRRRLRRRRHIITPHSPVGLVADADCKHDDAVIPGYLRCLLRHYWVLRLAVRDDDGDARDTRSRETRREHLVVHLVDGVMRPGSPAMLFHSVKSLLDLSRRRVAKHM